MASVDDTPVLKPAARIGLVLNVRTLFLVLLMSLTVASGVRRATDDVFPRYFIDLVDGHPSPVAPVWGFLFEGLLGDLVAYGFAWMGRDPVAIAGAWWLAGMALLSWSALHVCRSRQIPLEALCLLLIGLHLVDTLLLWIGKLDPLLLAALLLAAHPRRLPSAAGTVAAAFLHPLIAVLSVVGSHLAAGQGGLGPPRARIALCIGAACVDLLLFGHLFPEMKSRAGFVQSQLLPLLANGIQHGIPALLAGCLAPLALCHILLGQPGMRRSFGSVPFAVWLASVALLTAFLTRDHTRVFCLVTAVPLLIVASRLTDRGGLRGIGRSPALLVCVVAIRLAIPYVDGSGPEMFEWGIFTRHLGPS